MQADLYDALSQLMPRVSQTLTPPENRALVGILIDCSPIDAASKKKFRDASQAASQPNPMQQQAQQIELQDKEADVGVKKSTAMLNVARARAEGMPDQQEQGDGIDPRLKNMQAAADVQDTMASARHKNAQATKMSTETVLAPRQAYHDETMDHGNMVAQIERDKQAYKKQLETAQ
jgi:hypothetical protein